MQFFPHPFIRCSPGALNRASDSIWENITLLRPASGNNDLVANTKQIIQFTRPFKRWRAEEQKVTRVYCLTSGLRHWHFYSPDLCLHMPSHFWFKPLTLYSQDLCLCLERNTVTRLQVVGLTAEVCRSGNVFCTELITRSGMRHWSCQERWHPRH